MIFQKSALKLPSVYSAFDFIVGRFGLARLTLFSKYVPYTPGMKVLDLGCGTGASAPFFMPDDYLGIDIDTSYINSARSKYKGYEFLDQSFLDQSVNKYFPANGFDLVLAVGLFHHINNDLLTKYLEKTRKCLSNHGKLVSFDGCTYSGQSRIRRKVVLSDRGKYIRDKEDLLSLVENSGFQCFSFLEENNLLIPHSMLAISSSIQTT